MKIFIYGDSNTWGYVPNINCYSKDSIQARYPLDKIWWYPLTLQNEVKVNGLCGRAIANESPFQKGRNASKTISSDLKGVKADLTIIQLGTNDCKDIFNLTSEQIASSLATIAKQIQDKLNCKIMLISPAHIMKGNPVTDKYYKYADEKSVNLSKYYKEICEENGYIFVSGLDLRGGEDGEHLTHFGHRQLSERVLKAIEKMKDEEREM